jgi:hypothetical protein
MFLDAKREIYKNDLYEIAGFPSEIACLISSYIEPEKGVTVNCAPVFEIKQAGSFFIQQFYTNYHFGVTKTGISIGITGVFYLIPVCLLLDLVIYCCKKIRDPDPSFDFYVSESVYCVVAAAGAVLGAVISILPSFIHAAYCALGYQFSKANQVTSGTEIYALLKKLEMKNDKTFGKIISNIIEDYSENFHSWENFSGLLFIQDKNSEQLFQDLSNPAFSSAQKKRSH